MSSTATNPNSPTIDVLQSTQTLIPSLPNDVATLILARAPYSHHARLKSICKSWKLLYSSRTLISLRRNQSLTSHLICILPQDPSISAPYSIRRRWRGVLCHSCLAVRLCMDCVILCLCLLIRVYMCLVDHCLILDRFLDRPSPSSAVFRFDVVKAEWDSISPMLSARGSFACSVVPNLGRIFVAGGGSRHHLFGVAGSRMSSVEMYDIGKDEWVALAGLPKFRAGCVGFVIGNGEEREFWEMGGYGESRTVAGVLPVDQYYKDAVVIDVKDGGVWREIGDMWEDGERMRHGKIVVMNEDDCDLQGSPSIFMLDGSHIFRYDMHSNRWQQESSLPKKVTGSSFGFIALGGKLHILIPLTTIDQPQTRRSRLPIRPASTMLIQIYNPSTKTWRSILTKPPIKQLVDMNTAVMCSIHLLALLMLPSKYSL